MRGKVLAQFRLTCRRCRVRLRRCNEIGRGSIKNVILCRRRGIILVLLGPHRKMIPLSLIACSIGGEN